MHEFQSFCAMIEERFFMFSFGQKKSIYLDYAAATPCSTEVFAEMKPFFEKRFFNPSSASLLSREISSEIQKSRESIAKNLGVRAQEIFFYDGATEANNMLILGAVSAFKREQGIIPHIVASAIEHPSIVETLKSLLKRGEIELDFVPVDSLGRADLKALKNLLKENTALVSIGYVNNETGVVQDLKAISKILRKQRKKQDTLFPFLHSDIVQAINYVDKINPEKLGCDAVTISSGKIYGPKKMAALYRKKSLTIDPIFFGGTQESSYRSGTENVPYIVGFAKALENARKKQKEENERLSHIHKKFTEELSLLFPELIMNTPSLDLCSPHIVNISFPRVAHEEILFRLEESGYICSMKSACKSGEEGDSHVILAIRGENENHLPTGSLRISFGKDTVWKDLENFLKDLSEIIKLIEDTHQRFLP
ncbi:MAG: cysteine desulfurase family protein [Candidatus Pacebacteria bacterium]|nr:cysteine desulfurase family protein [Candidatus Paceibacterota bacterium]